MMGMIVVVSARFALGEVGQEVVAGPRCRGGDDGAARAGGRARHPSARQPRPRLQTAGPANDRGQY